MIPRPSTPKRAAPSRILPRVYVSQTPKVNVVHFPPETKFYGDPQAGSGKAHVPRTTK